MVDLVDALRCAISCSELRTSCSRAVWYSCVTAGACIAISAKPNAAASGIGFAATRRAGRLPREILLLSIKINDGVVMAADSASSFASGMVYRHADKIVNLR